MNKTVRDAAWVVSSGTSDASGAPLEDGQWHVDHIRPRAAGGTDDVSNLRAVTADENTSKSCAQPPEPRAWQQRYIEKWRASRTPDFLLVALPGAGKTFAALATAREWIEADPVRRRVLIVVPTDPLRTQWKDEAAQLFGLQFQTKEFHTFKNQYNGGIITYQLVASGAQSAIFKMLCAKWDTLVICDEIHHAGDQNEWGVMLRDAIAPAAKRLLMSGTPFRGDRTRIPFVNYDGDGQCIADDRYDYPDAIRDNVIRIVRFQHDKGIVRRISLGGVEESPELHSQLTDEIADGLLRSVLVPGNYTETLLRQAHAKLLECRRHMPNAGGLVLCIDQDHAEKIALQLARISGAAPDLIVSDDERATSTVKSFRESNRMWVVAVRKMSEGVDVKRLMVLAYLTTTRTELFFRQAIGRIVRNLQTEHDMESYCFIPDHPTLVRCAQNITNAQAQAIEDEPGEEREGKPREPGQTALWPFVIGTEHSGTAGSIIDGDRLSPEQASLVSQIALEEGSSERIVWKVMQRIQATPTPAPPMGGMRSQMPPLEDREKKARLELMKVCQKVAFRISDPPDFARINSLINQHIGKKREAFTLEDCRLAKLFASTLGQVVA